ncbi:hypothetical protein ACP275_08G099700 [Erythranthe tilingii]
MISFLPLFSLPPLSLSLTLKLTATHDTYYIHISNSALHCNEYKGILNNHNCTVSHLLLLDFALYFYTWNLII